MKKREFNGKLKGFFFLAAALVMLQSLYRPNVTTGGITSGVTIPPNQEFVLGEYNHPDYRSVLMNKSEFEVGVELRNRKTNVLLQRFDLSAGSSAKVNVSKDEMVILKNSNNNEVLIKVKANRNIKGMRYQDLDAYED